MENMSKKWASGAQNGGNRALKNFSSQILQSALGLRDINPTLVGPLADFSVFLFLTFFNLFYQSCCLRHGRGVSTLIELFFQG